MRVHEWAWARVDMGTRVGMGTCVDGTFEERGKQPKVSTSLQGPSTLIWDEVSQKPGVLTIGQPSWSMSFQDPAVFLLSHAEFTGVSHCTQLVSWVHSCMVSAF